MQILDSLPDSSRVWIFTSKNTLSEQEAEKIKNSFDSFLSEWNAHKQSVSGAYEILYNKFIIFGANQEATPVSGCSIDSLCNMVKNTLEELGLPLIGHESVLYKHGDKILQCSRPDFKALVDSKELSSETLVFNNTITTLAEMRASKWECRMEDSWHAKAFL